MTRRFRPPKRPKRAKPTRATKGPELSRLEHGALTQLPETTRARVKWLSKLLDVSELAVLSMAVAEFARDWDDGDGGGYDPTG